MPEIQYVEKRFSDKVQKIIAQGKEIVREYREQGYSLTLRQLYYQFVARGLIANKQAEYNRLGRIISDARLAGAFDWDSIEDRTRNLQRLSTWESPAEIMAGAAASFRRDLWAPQPNYVEVWIEKEALVGVIAATCNRLRVPYFACRGYVSQSEMWGAAHYRFRARTHSKYHGQRVSILHLGDHDPSGIDMTRDIRERLSLFVGAEIEVERLALNMDQVEEFRPPPNPAKITDSRYEGYVAEHGHESWELDALEPRVINELIEEAVSERVDRELWAVHAAAEERDREDLRRAQERWDLVSDFLREFDQENDDD